MMQLHLKTVKGAPYLNLEIRIVGYLYSVRRYSVLLIVAKVLVFIIFSATFYPLAMHLIYKKNGGKITFKDKKHLMILRGDHPIASSSDI